MAFLREIYHKNPRLYTLCELCVVLGGIFVILWILRFCYWGPYLSALTGTICTLVFLSSFFVHEDTLKDLGIRADNLSRSFKEASIAALLCVGLTLCIFMFYRESYKPHNPGKVFLDILAYSVWGTLQQFGLNSFLYLRLKKVLINKDAAIILAAGLFSLIHAPNMGLVAFTSVGGLIFCYLFSRNRNIFSLGVMHGVVAVAALTLLVPGYMKNFSVGPPGLERYDAYGNSPLVCAGDVNGDGKEEILVSKGPARESDSEVLVLTGDGILVNRFPVFDAESRYGANLASGDIDGDGLDEIIAARGPWHKNDTLITVLTGSGRELRRFYAFPEKRYGANITAGDLNGDGKDEIIAGMGPGQGYRPVIRIFSGNGTLLREFQVEDIIEAPDYYRHLRHGIRVSSGDIDGDGRDEIVASAPHLHPYQTYCMTIDLVDSALNPVESKWFRVFIPGARYGLNTAIGDVTGDGASEIVAGPGPYSYSTDDLKVLGKGNETIFEIFPFNAHYGVTVATADLEGDGVPEILASPGIGEEKPGFVIKVLDIHGLKKDLDLRPYFK